MAYNFYIVSDWLLELLVTGATTIDEVKNNSLATDLTEAHIAKMLELTAGVERGDFQVYLKDIFEHPDVFPRFQDLERAINNYAHNRGITKAPTPDQTLELILQWVSDQTRDLPDIKKIIAKWETRLNLRVDSEKWPDHLEVVIDAARTDATESERRRAAAADAIRLQRLIKLLRESEQSLGLDPVPSIAANDLESRLTILLLRLELEIARWRQRHADLRIHELETDARNLGDDEYGWYNDEDEDEDDFAQAMNDSRPDPLPTVPDDLPF